MSERIEAAAAALLELFTSSGAVTATPLSMATEALAAADAVDPLRQGAAA